MSGRCLLIDDQEYMVVATPFSILKHEDPLTHIRIDRIKTTVSTTMSFDHFNGDDFVGLFSLDIGGTLIYLMFHSL